MKVMRAVERFSLKNRYPRLFLERGEGKRFLEEGEGDASLAPLYRKFYLVIKNSWFAGGNRLLKGSDGWEVPDKKQKRPGRP